MQLDSKNLVYIAPFMRNDGEPAYVNPSEAARIRARYSAQSAKTSAQSQTKPNAPPSNDTLAQNQPSRRPTVTVHAKSPTQPARQANKPRNPTKQKTPRPTNHPHHSTIKKSQRTAQLDKDYATQLTQTPTPSASAADPPNPVPNTTPRSFKTCAQAHILPSPASVAAARQAKKLTKKATPLLDDEPLRVFRQRKRLPATPIDRPNSSPPDSTPPPRLGYYEPRKNFYLGVAGPSRVAKNHSKTIGWDLFRKKPTISTHQKPSDYRSLPAAKNLRGVVMLGNDVRTAQEKCRHVTPQIWAKETIPRMEAASMLDDTVCRAFENGAATKSERLREKQLKRFEEFAKLRGIDAKVFFNSPEPFPSHAKLTKENEIMAQFMAFLLQYPVIGNKTPVYSTLAAAVMQINVIFQTRNGRRPGRNVTNIAHPWFQRVQKGFKLLASKSSPGPRPINQAELALMRNVLDLKDNAQHRLWWAAWTTMFQAVCRPADILSDAFHKKLSISRTDIQAARTLDDQGKPGPPKFVITLAKTKTDQAAIQRQTKSLPWDDDPNSISAAVAIYHMLDKDKSDGADDITPLFCHPGTRLPFRPAQNAMAFADTARKAGLDMTRLSPYSLRIGGNSSYTAARDGGETVALSMGGWRSKNTQQIYTYASQSHIERASMQVAKTSINDFQNRVAFSRNSCLD